MPLPKSLMLRQPASTPQSSCVLMVTTWSSTARGAHFYVHYCALAFSAMCMLRVCCRMRCLTHNSCAATAWGLSSWNHCCWYLNPECLLLQGCICGREYLGPDGQVTLQGSARGDPAAAGRHGAGRLDGGPHMGLLPGLRPHRQPSRQGHC